MRKLTRIKNIIIGAFIFSLLFVFSPSVYAYDCSDYSRAMNNGETPYLSELICPIIGLINVAIGVVAGIFVIIVVYGAIKASMALGDPKALKSAHQTWLYAVIGIFIVLLSVSIIVIVLGIFGVNFGGTTSWLDGIQNALKGIQNADAFK